MNLTGKGTTGDSFLFNCILYNPEREDTITVEQYICPDVDRAEQEMTSIRDIYSLSSNVEVKFIDQDEWRDYMRSEGPAVPGAPPGFRPSPNHCSRRGILPSTPYPEFSFPKTDHNIGQDYVACSPKSGLPNHVSREVGQEELNRIVLGCPSIKFVLVGKNEEYVNYAKPNVLNLVGKTSLLEAMGIVARAKGFIGIQGLMAYVSLSQRVPSVVYTKTRNHSVGFMGRLFPEWMNYCTLYTRSLSEDPSLFKDFVERCSP